MNLTEALWILDRAHTRDDAQAGYVVETLPQVFEHTRSEYIEAWGVVRAALRPETSAICNVCGGKTHLGCCNGSALREVMQDAIAGGAGFLKIHSDGTRERIAPEDIYLKPDEISS